MTNKMRKGAALQLLVLNFSSKGWLLSKPLDAAGGPVRSLDAAKRRRPGSDNPGCFPGVANQGRSSASKDAMSHATRHAKGHGRHQGRCGWRPA